jgi:uncharacterized membrane protein YdjX (TVP38/TMEM64 family)
MPRPRGVTVRRLVLLAVLLAGIACAFIWRRYLTVPQIQAFVGSLGSWGPLVFMLVYTVGPAFLVPGLPLDLAAGVLFGPVWGTVYSLVGATAGATVAFLAARTVGRDWTEEKLSGPLKKLKEGVDKGGWEFVAFVRLVPVIPFNLLNYALGLTRIGLVPYVLASFVFMAPATVVYVYAGWAGGEALAGEGTISQTLVRVLVALSALGMLAILPQLAVRFAKSRRTLPR